MQHISYDNNGRNFVNTAAICDHQYIYNISFTGRDPVTIKYSNNKMVLFVLTAYIIQTHNHILNFTKKKLFSTLNLFGSY